MPRHRSLKLPYADLLAASRADCDRQAAEALDVSMREVVRWRKEGVPLSMADTLAIRLWMHPISVWGELWIEAERVEAALRDARAARQVALRAARRERARLAGWAEVERSWRQWAAQQERHTALD